MDNLDLKPKIKSKKNLLYKVIKTIVLLGIIIGLSFIANKFVLKPYRYKKLADETKNLYYNEEPDSIEDNADHIRDNNDFIKDDTDANDIQESKDRDEEGRLTQFKDILKINEDVKGWISIPGSNIDYPIAQSDENNPEFYLYRNLYKEDDKAGTIFLDIKSSVEDNTKNLVLHGHNMASTNNMFHHLIK